MAGIVDGVEVQIAEEERGYRYFRNAVERHWDPFDIELERDRENLVEYSEENEDLMEYTDMLRKSLAMFGAGEEAVTEDLAPFAIAFDGIEDQMFITTQMYEEAKHTEFFDRYWKEVVHPVEEELGMEKSSPRDPEFYSPGYEELFDREEEALNRLLTDDTPENRVIAHAHYHLTVEGILAQTGYWGLTRTFEEDGDDDIAHLPGLVEGIAKIRSDEGRHVGFGMSKIKHGLEEDGVDEDVLNETLAELVPLVNQTTNYIYEDVDDPGELPGPNPGDLASYALEKHQDRMGQITDDAASVPDIQELTALD